MTLKEINDTITALPTVMTLTDEALLIDAIMTIPFAELARDPNSLNVAIRALELSHTDSGFMELTAENEGVFVNFHRWLTKANDEIGLELSVNTIDSFSLTADDVKKLML